MTGDCRISVWACLSAVLALAGLSVLAIADPATNPLFPPCLWRAATGWLCPGCGSTRAIHAMLRGQFGAAVQASPLAVGVMPLLAADLIQRWRQGESVMTTRARPAYIVALGLGIAIFGVLRNIIQ